MAGSVGIGGLIIGVSLLVVFSMAVQTMSYQMETSMEVLDAAADPVLYWMFNLTINIHCNGFFHLVANYNTNSFFS